ncbi:hypothetical protein ACQEU3_15075 [Spirillospora sp. CA-253888]
MAQQQLAAAQNRRSEIMTEGEIAELIKAAGGIKDAIAKADVEDKNRLYEQLGVRLTYHPGSRKVRAEITLSPDLSSDQSADRGSVVRVRGGNEPVTPTIPLAASLTIPK